MGISLSLVPSGGGIYTMRCIPENREYIGQAAQLAQRIDRHFNLLRLGRHHVRALQDDYVKHGYKAFTVEIVHLENDPESRNNLEQNLIRDMAARKKIYNKAFATTVRDGWGVTENTVPANAGDCLTLADIGRIIGKPRLTVYRWMQRDHMIKPALAAKSLTLFQPRDVIAWLERTNRGEYVERISKACEAQQHGDAAQSREG